LARASQEALAQTNHKGKLNHSGRGKRLSSGRRLNKKEQKGPHSTLTSEKGKAVMSHAEKAASRRTNPKKPGEKDRRGPKEETKPHPRRKNGSFMRGKKKRPSSGKGTVEPLFGRKTGKDGNLEPKLQKARRSNEVNALVPR